MYFPALTFTCEIVMGARAKGYSITDISYLRLRELGKADLLKLADGLEKDWQNFLTDASLLNIYFSYIGN